MYLLCLSVHSLRGLFIFSQYPVVGPKKKLHSILQPHVTKMLQLCSNYMATVLCIMDYSIRKVEFEKLTTCSTIKLPYAILHLFYISFLLMHGNLFSIFFSRFTQFFSQENTKSSTFKI